MVLPVFLAPITVAAGADNPAPSDASSADTDAAYDTAKDLFDQFAPADVKRDYYFPSRQEFDAALRQLQAAFDGNSIPDLAQRETDARQALAALRAAPGGSDYADWLYGRVDEVEAAHSIVEAEHGHPTPPPVRKPILGALPSVPYYDLWYRRLHDRPPPSDSNEIMGVLRSAFAAEGVPPELAWLAEVESSLNPNAHNPSGARGLFQLKTATAQGLGLSTFMPDERTNPDRSAHAAARLLRKLKAQFGSWPLAIAAYNAGPGRVAQAQAAGRGRGFADIASSLPAGTQMYVPEVCALVAIRTGRAVAR
jgi:membrane-bound lytic murein transglycosylase D